MTEQPQPAAARAFVEAERRLMEPLPDAPWRARCLALQEANGDRIALAKHGGWLAHVRTSHAQALDIIQQQADEIDRLRALVGEMEGEVLRKTAELQEEYERQQF